MSFVASRLRGKGFNIICPNHYGLCTANLAEDAVIGNETVYSKKCAVEVSDYLKISHITTDGDSKIKGKAILFIQFIDARK
jgi:hypothetical protein